MNSGLHPIDPESPEIHLDQPGLGFKSPNGEGGGSKGPLPLGTWSGQSENTIDGLGPSGLPSGLELRPYQQDALEAIRAGFRDHARMLTVLPTGAGKTVLFSHLAAERVRAGQRVLILAHREELLQQAQDKLKQATGLDSELEKADHQAGLDARVVVASVQTLKGKRLQRWPVGHFGLVIVDEAHHALAASYRTILDHFSEAQVLGVTATPNRGDRKTLGAVFEHVAMDVPMADLVPEYLCPITVQNVPLGIDLSRVGSQAGDYKAGDLGTALDPYLEKIASRLPDLIGDRRTLVFLPLVKTSQRFAGLCSRADLRAAHVDGQSEDRESILKEFREGRTQVLCNAQLLTEGFDDPGISCVIVLRPTRSEGLYRQMVGRGTRPAAGKTDLLLLDFLWQHQKHAIIRPAHLIAETEEVAKTIVGRDGDLMALAREVDRELSLARELERASTRNRADLDLLRDPLSVHYTPSEPWHRQPLSDQQGRYLEQKGVEVSHVVDRGHASQIISLLQQREGGGLASYKQALLLKRLKVPTPFAVRKGDVDQFGRGYGN